MSDEKEVTALQSFVESAVAGAPRVVASVVAELLTNPDPGAALVKAVAQYGLGTVLDAGVRFVRRRAGAATRQLESAEQFFARDGVALFEREVRERLALVEHEQRLLSLLPDHQFWRLQRNYEFEYEREPMDERRRMLEYAAAGALDVDLTVAQLARVERTLRELDPSDVHELFRLGIEAPRIKLRPSGKEFDSLEAAGCVRFTEKTGIYGQDAYPIGSFAVNELGHNILSVLSKYIGDAASGSATASAGAQPQKEG